MGEVVSTRAEARQLLGILSGWLWVGNGKEVDAVCTRIEKNYFLFTEPKLMERMSRRGGLCEDDIPFLKKLFAAYSS